jgi:hypothetical protein
MTIFCFSKNSEGDNYGIKKKPHEIKNPSCDKEEKSLLLIVLKIVFTILEKKPNLQCTSSNCNYNI